MSVPLSSILITLAAIFVAAVPAFLALFVLIVWSRFRKRSLERRGVRHPLANGLLRPAGHSTWEQYKKLDAQFDELMASTLMGSIAGVYSIPTMAYFQGKRIGAESIVVLVVMLAFFVGTIFWKMRSVLERRASYRLGWEGELAAAEELNRVMLNGHRVYHDVPGDGFNIDHVVVSTSGVFAFETKTRTKRKNDDGDDFKVIYDGKTLNFSGYRTEEPLLQAKRQARWLRSFLTRSTGEEVYVRPAVIVPGWWVERPVNQKADVSVLNAKQAVSLVRHGGRLDEAGVQRVCFQLEQLCRGVELSKPLN